MKDELKSAAQLLGAMTLVIGTILFILWAMFTKLVELIAEVTLSGR